MKQPPRGVLSKRCSENMQQIYSRTPMSKCDFKIIMTIIITIIIILKIIIRLSLIVMIIRVIIIIIITITIIIIQGQANEKHNMVQPTF